MRNLLKLVEICIAHGRLGGINSFGAEAEVKWALGDTHHKHCRFLSAFGQTRSMFSATR